MCPFCPRASLQIAWYRISYCYLSEFNGELSVCVAGVLFRCERCFCEALGARQGEDPWSLLAGKKRGRESCEKFGASGVETLGQTVSGSSSDGEDGAALRPCHVSVCWTNTDISQRDSSVGSLVMLLSSFSLCRGGWTVLHFWSSHLANSGKCGVGFDQLHRRYSGGVLRFVVRTLCRLFSGLQKSGSRH